MLRRLLLGNLALASIIGASVLPATAYGSDRNQPTRLVVGFAPGGVADILARTFADKLEAQLGETILVENRPGASARIATEYVKRAAPDGKTILISSPSPIVVFPYTYKNLRYDPEKDLTPVAHLADIPLAISVGANRPLKSMADYIAWVKQTPDARSVGVPSLGSPVHFGLMTLSKSIQVPLTPVAYKGASPMLTELVGGSLPAGAEAIGGQMELYKAGKIRFLGLSGVRRSALLPDVPTLKEIGINGFEMATGWYAVFVPAGTPKAMVAKLEKAFVETAKDPAVLAKLSPLGIEVTGRNSAELQKHLQAERAFWKPIVAASGFTAND